MRAVVLGAGPAGLAAADVLSANGARTIVIEAREGPGGLARSERVGAHLADLGPHRLDRGASRRSKSMFDTHAKLVDKERRAKVHADRPLSRLKNLGAKLAAEAKRRAGVATREERYLYPSTGANGLAYDAWANTLAERGVIFHFGTEVSAIEHAGGRVTNVRADTLRLNVDRIISTLALPRLAERLSPATAFDARALSLRTLVMLYVVIARARLSDRDVHYFPEERAPFARMTEQRAFGSIGEAPKNETVLAFDFYDEPGGRYTRADKAELLALVLPFLSRFGVAKGDVRDVHTAVAPDAYPVLEHGFQTARDRALDALASIEGLISTGRGGLFLHVNQHHAIDMGCAAAQIALLPRGASRSWREVARAFECAEVAD